MNKILEISKIKELKNFLLIRNKSIVLVGGCFDILHPGHIIFLEKAKKQADILIVLLESDERIKILKGEKRPIHNQEERAFILSSLKFIDYILLLPTFDLDLSYDKIIMQINPQIIAVTKGDINIEHKQRSAGLLGAKIKIVTDFIGDYSTTGILSKNSLISAK